MSDPVSLVLCVVAITIHAVQTSKALLEFIADIRCAPGNIKAIYKEVHALYDVVFSLHVVLKDQDMQTIISGDKALMNTVEGLTKPVNNCRAILGQLSEKLERLHISCTESRNVLSSFVAVRWSLVSKNEIRRLQQNLEAEKLTISVALNVINKYASFSA